MASTAPQLASLAGIAEVGARRTGLPLRRAGPR
ncbi:hypothetical protein QF026_001197 [Streptomyces aurantiacus]|nr:hypothetical protein [Streptomyces aurantiacus]